MGNWALHIFGHGQHHNGGDPADADTILKNTVAELQDKGHTVSHASITHGSHEDIATSTDEKAKEATDS